MVKLSLVDYNQYFDKKYIDNTQLEYLDLGELNLTTGKIIVCDPLVGLYSASPLTKSVKPGKYPVIACVAKTKSSGDRYAVVKIQFSIERATKWELAVVHGQDTNSLKEDEFFGFPVDAGLGCFCDVEAQELFNQFESDFMTKNPEENIYDNLLEDEFKKNAIDPNDPQDVGDWLNFYLPNEPNLNVIMFHSGYGDGVYSSYWGITNDGEICSLIIDFQVFELSTE